MKKIALFILLILFSITIISCGSSGSENESKVTKNEKTVKIKKNLSLIFCDFPQSLDETGEDSKSHSDQIFKRIDPILDKIIGKRSLKEDRKQNHFSIKVYPLYDYTANSSPLGVFICSENEYLNGDLTERERKRECKKQLKNDFNKFIKNSSSSGQIRIINSLKVLNLIQHESNEYDNIEIFYVSNLLERVFQPDKSKAEFNFIDENKFVDPLSIQSAIQQLEDENSPLIKIIKSQKLSSLNKTKIHILSLTDFQVENKQNISMSDIKSFWINFFKKAGFSCSIYDRASELNI